MPGGGYGDPNMAETGPQTDVSSVTVAPPTGPGWVIELAGYHYYNDKNDRKGYGPLHVRNTLLKQLKDGEIDLPLGPGKPMARFKMKDLGIGYAILAYSGKPKPHYVQNPNWTPPTAGTGTGVPGIGGPGLPAPGLASAPLPGAAGLTGPGGLPGAPGAVAQDPNNPEYFQVTKYEFAVQFVWQEKPLLVRLQKMEEERLAAEKAAAEKAAGDAAANGGAQPAAPGVPQAVPAPIPQQPPAGQQPPVAAAPPPANEGQPPAVAPGGAVGNGAPANGAAPAPPPGVPDMP